MEVKQLRTSPVVNSVQKSPHKVVHPVGQVSSCSPPEPPICRQEKETVTSVPPNLAPNCPMMTSESLLSSPHREVLSTDGDDNSNNNNNSGAISDEDTLDRLKKTAENIVADVTEEVSSSLLFILRIANPMSINSIDLLLFKFDLNFSQTIFKFLNMIEIIKTPWIVVLFTISSMS